jgi:hypothetical protein
MPACQETLKPKNCFVKHCIKQDSYKLAARCCNYTQTILKPLQTQPYLLQQYSTCTSLSHSAHSACAADACSRATKSQRHAVHIWCTWKLQLQANAGSSSMPPKLNSSNKLLTCPIWPAMCRNLGGLRRPPMMCSAASALAADAISASHTHVWFV